MSDDYKSVLLVGALNDLAKATENGFVDFETFIDNPDAYENWLVYDKRNRKVVHSWVNNDELPRGILDYYDFFFPGVEIKALEDEDGAYVSVKLPRGYIEVEHGAWYVVNYYTCHMVN